jgi:hypothetical protein
MHANYFRYIEKNRKNITVRIVTVPEGMSQLFDPSWFVCRSFLIWHLVEGTASKSLDNSTHGPAVVDSGWYGLLYSSVCTIAWAPGSRHQMSQ